MLPASAPSGNRHTGQNLSRHHIATPNASPPALSPSAATTGERLYATLVEPAVRPGEPIVEAAISARLPRQGRLGRAKSPASTSPHSIPATSRVIILPDGSLNGL